MAKELKRITQQNASLLRCMLAAQFEYARATGVYDQKNEGGLCVGKWVEPRLPPGWDVVYQDERQ
jgi:hypothetical protein